MRWKLSNCFAGGYCLDGLTQSPIWEVLPHRGTEPDESERCAIESISGRFGNGKGVEHRSSPRSTCLLSMMRLLLCGYVVSIPVIIQVTSGFAESLAGRSLAPKKSIRPSGCNIRNDKCRMVEPQLEISRPLPYCNPLEFIKCNHVSGAVVQFRHPRRFMPGDCLCVFNRSSFSKYAVMPVSRNVWQHVEEGLRQPATFAL